MVMGTAGYMAPEQVRGLQVDGRADLFSLGVVLYEMVAGHRAFARESAVESLNAILKDDPPELTTTRPDLPPALDRIVRHCLEKSPAERFQSARDVIFALETLTGTSGSGSVPPALVPAARGTLTGARLGWAVAALATAALIAAIVAPRTPAPIPGSARFVAIGAPHQRFFTHAAPAISPDGTTVAFWAPDADGRVQLWVRNLGGPQARALPDTVIAGLEMEGFQPAFSPDGRTLLAFMDGKLKRVALDGGSPQTLVDAANPRGATWGAGDQIVYQPAVGGPLFMSPPRVARRVRCPTPSPSTIDAPDRATRFSCPMESTSCFPIWPGSTWRRSLAASRACSSKLPAGRSTHPATCCT